MCDNDALLFDDMRPPIWRSCDCKDCQAERKRQRKAMDRATLELRRMIWGKKPKDQK